MHPGSEPAGKPPVALTDAQEKELLQFLQQNHPEQAKRLAELKQNNAMRYQWAIRAAWRWYERWRNMPKDVQEAFITADHARVKVWRLANQVHDATSPEEKTRLEGELRQTVLQMVQAEQKIREYRLKQLEEEIERLRADLRDRQAKLEKIVDHRVERLIKNPPTTQRSDDFKSFPGDGPE
jgi:hypothetical protein